MEPYLTVLMGKGREPVVDQTGKAKQMLASLTVFHLVTVGQRFPDEAILQKPVGLRDGVQARCGCDPETQGSQGKQGSGMPGSETRQPEGREHN